MSQHNFPSAATTAVMLSAVSCADTAAATTAGVDLLTYDGPLIFIQQKGLGTGSLAGEIQDSANNSDFASVTGATFASVTTAAATEKIVVQRKAFRRYVRYLGTIVTGPQIISVTMTGVKKYV